MKLLQKIRWFFIALVLSLSFGNGMAVSAHKEAVSAQPLVSDNWSKPLNLSHSGAASLPHIVAGPNGVVQAFWLDQFDGLTTSIFASDPFKPGSAPAWSEPRSALIFINPLEPIKVMPYLVADSQGIVHAFWYGLENALMYSQLPIGSTVWSPPQTVADSVLAYDVAVPTTGPITLAYIRSLHNSLAQAGVYVKRKMVGGWEWGFPVAAYTSIYFRLLSQDQAHLSLADAGNGFLILSWDEPHMKQALYSHSKDGGLSWSNPEPVGNIEQHPAHTRIVAVPGGKVFRLWQTTNCDLFQQYLVKSEQTAPVAAPETITVTKTATSTPVITETWTVPQPIFENSGVCPAKDRVLPLSGNENLIWVWDVGSAGLGISVWDASQSQWSIPQVLTFDFTDPETTTEVQLDNLDFTLVGDKLEVVGADLASGEVWVTEGKATALQLAYGQSSPWSESASVAIGNQFARNPAVAVDSKGLVHVIWSQSAKQVGTGAFLFYIRYNGQDKTLPANIIDAASDELVRQPMLFCDPQDFLHMVWSGGGAGEILYSRAPADRADASSEWLNPEFLSYIAGSSWPQIARDSNSGRLFVVFVVPFNEQRGVYLVRSDNSGDTWTDPQRIFDGVASKWQMVNHPTMVITPDGVLHVAWVQSTMPDLSGPQAIFYSQSHDLGITWTTPINLSGGQSDWPRLIVNNGNLHLLYADTEGRIYHRWVDLTKLTPDGSSWTNAVGVPSWQDIALPFGVYADGPDARESSPKGTIHLLGIEKTTGNLLYSTWNGELWNNPEILTTQGQIVDEGNFAVSSRPVGGVLSVTWFADLPGSKQTLFVMNRKIPAVQVPQEAAVTAVPTPTSSSSSDATPLPPQPTAKPTLENVPLPAKQGFAPIIIGGGLAAFIVLLLFIILVARKR